MEFDKPRWSCPWNSDQSDKRYTKLCQGVVRVKRVGVFSKRWWGSRVWWGGVLGLGGGQGPGDGLEVVGSGS